MNIKRLRSLREDSDMSQDDLAAKLGIPNRSSISDWETGRETIPLRKLNKYANFFNVSIDYILGLTKSKEYHLVNKSIDLEVMAKRLKEVRIKNGLTQEQLAKELNTTHSTLSAYENAKVLITTSFIYQIAKKHNVSIDWILGKVD